MSAKREKIVGKPLPEFAKLFSHENGVFLHPARLIPMYKLGDEMALTSAFLSSLGIIKEFRKQIFGAVGLPVSGTLHCFTEIGFKEFENLRLDGLIVVEKAGKVVDAAFLEMKNGNDELQAKQLESYFEIAKKVGVPRLITVSNQFVSHPSQSPVNVKPPKAVEQYHLSWSYILTIAQLLLQDNDENIEDETQRIVMNEVVEYFQLPKSGINGFNQMKKGWKATVENITAGSTLRQKDPELIEAIESWIQEEKDMALVLSRELGLLVQTGEKRFRNDYTARVAAEAKNIVDKRRLRSKFKVDGAASDIEVEADFGKRTLSMAIELDAPQDRQLRGQIGWLNQQLKRCAKKSEMTWQKIANEISIDVHIKYGGTERIKASEEDRERLIENNKGKSLKGYSIVQVKDLGKNFSNQKKYVQTAEEMLLNFYEAVVQHLKNWEPPAPQMEQRSTGEVDETTQEA